MHVQRIPSPASGNTHPELAEVEAGLSAQVEALQSTVGDMQNTLRGKEEEIVGLHARISELQKDLTSKEEELVNEREKSETEKKNAVATAKKEMEKQLKFSSRPWRHMPRALLRWLPLLLPST